MRAAASTNVNLFALLNRPADSDLPQIVNTGRWKGVVNGEEKIALKTRGIGPRLTNDDLSTRIRRFQELELSADYRQ